MTDWLSHLQAALTTEKAVMLITVGRVRGSGPREAGAHMVVTRRKQFGTIGGGRLEYEATQQARDMLERGETLSVWREYPLGPSLGQCCGGVTALLFEPVTPKSAEWVAEHLTILGTGGAAVSVVSVGGQNRRTLLSFREGDTLFSPAHVRERARQMVREGKTTNLFLEDSKGGRFFLECLRDDRTKLYLFGAGHVGRALVRILDGLPFQVTWVDGRAEMFPNDLPANVCKRVIKDAQSVVREAPPEAFYLVMTHNHELDFEICAAILERGDFAYAGLIGSQTKRARFEKRFQAQSLVKTDVNRLTCPIGVEGISGKSPAEVALATAAEVQICREVRGKSI